MIWKAAKVENPDATTLREEAKTDRLMAKFYRNMATEKIREADEYDAHADRLERAAAALEAA